VGTQTATPGLCCRPSRNHAGARARRPQAVPRASWPHARRGTRPRHARGTVSRARKLRAGRGCAGHRAHHARPRRGHCACAGLRWSIACRAGPRRGELATRVQAAASKQATRVLVGRGQAAAHRELGRARPGALAEPCDARGLGRTRARPRATGTMSAGRTTELQARARGTQAEHARPARTPCPRAASTPGELRLWHVGAAPGATRNGKEREVEGGGEGELTTGGDNGADGRLRGVGSGGSVRLGDVEERERVRRCGREKGSRGAGLSGGGGCTRAHQALAVKPLAHSCRLVRRLRGAPSWAAQGRGWLGRAGEVVGPRVGRNLGCAAAPRPPPGGAAPRGPWGIG
jgi:hypothetical protein